ncbi:MAG: acyltransferase domain-containing protein, partial [Streptomyces sp.]|nr:acyltransferase domain-containing protein [Streptomyces sp.]
AFAFTGQGSQHLRMAAAWYRSCPAYARHLDDIDKVLAPHTGVSVRDAVLDGDPEAGRARLAQPALFAVQYAMASTLAEAGIRPSYVIGHSVGEFAAACAAGALDAADAARLVARRGALMDTLPQDGGMLAVSLPAAAAESLLVGRRRLGLAAVNGPDSVVISGDLTELAAVEAELAERKVAARRLSVSHAFHSPLMRPVVAGFRAECADVPGRRPRIPVLSTVYGRALAGAETLDADYWAEQIGAPVRFAEAAGALLAEQVGHIVEIGPRAVLTPLLARLCSDLDHPVRLHAAHPGERASGHRPLELLGELWSAGLSPDWDVLYDGSDRVPRRLPPYRFDDTFRAWRSATPPGPGEPSTSAVPPDVDTTAVPSAPAEEPPDSLAALTRRLVRRVGGHGPDQVHDHARLHEDLGFDSIRVMELKTRIEDALPDLAPLPVEELLASLRTVADLTHYLRERTGETPARLATAPPEAASSATAAPPGAAPQGPASSAGAPAPPDPGAPSSTPAPEGARS